MKKIPILLLLAFVASVCFFSCKPKVNIEKEKEAIKAVFEQEKNAFYNQDCPGMAETWVQEPTSTKIYMNAKEQLIFEGWDKINAQSQKEVSDTSWNRKLVKTSFLNYKIDVLGNSAWVLCNALPMCIT